MKPVTIGGLTEQERRRIHLRRFGILKDGHMVAADIAGKTDADPINLQR